MLFKADETDSAGVEASTETGSKVRQVLCSQRGQVSSLALALVETSDQTMLLTNVAASCQGAAASKKKLPGGHSDAVGGHRKARAMP